MTSKIQIHHRQKMAYVYLRQSTMAQVYHHQESTQRQYALKDRALELGWPADQIRVLDADLGQSGTQMNNRQDFKTLVADVSLEKVGAVFALEASRLSRSCSDWHRLLEICSLTGTLIVDADGCYDPADFNDQLLLGLKGTMSQAELHFIRARLQGGKRNKAQRGELRFPLPVGYVYGDEPGSVLLDPDAESKCGAIGLPFFRQTGSAYGVVRHFRSTQLEFSPARLRRGLEWKDHLGQAATRTSAGSVEQSLLCRSLRLRSLSVQQIHIDRRPDSVQSAETADRLLAGLDPGASSRLHQLGGLFGKPADLVAEDQ